jgi:hypothetical protein
VPQPAEGGLMLPPRVPKTAKRASRWVSNPHKDFVREFACCFCLAKDVPRQAAHVRMGSGAGIGQKPDDWRTVPLCAPCHNGDQHTKLGEAEFWRQYHKRHGQTVDQLLDALTRASPKRAEIERIQRERGQ